MVHSEQRPRESRLFDGDEHGTVEAASSEDAARSLLDEGWDWVGLNGEGRLLLAEAGPGRAPAGPLVIAEGGAAPGAHGLRLDRPGRPMQLRWFATARAADADYLLLIDDYRAGRRGGLPCLLARIESGAVVDDVLLEPP